MADALLALEGLRAGYGDAVVLDHVSLEVPEHGSLAVLGRNGVGKTTLILSIMGCTQTMRGAVKWRGSDITGVSPAKNTGTLIVTGKSLLLYCTRAANRHTPSFTLVTLWMT